MLASRPEISATGPEILITREFDAPVDLVWTAWTVAKHVAKWWGPHRYTNPVCELDARPGGDILIHMQAPNGVVYPMTGKFEEVVEPERLVFTTTLMDIEGHTLVEDTNTVTFSERDGRTALHLVATVLSPTTGNSPYVEGLEGGWIQSLERLRAALKDP